MIRISDSASAPGAAPDKLPFDINRGMGNIKTTPLVSYSGAPSGDPQIGATDAAAPPAPLASAPKPDKAALLKKLFRIKDANVSTPKAAVPQPPIASKNDLYEAKKKEPASHDAQHKLLKRIDTSA